MLVLRQQIIVLRRAGRARLTFSAMDRFVLGWLCALFPGARSALSIVQPETVLRWHRAGFRAYWRWKSRRRVGRPAVSAEVRQLIREMSVANPLWGAPRVHGELLKLGITVGQTSVAKYMVRRRGPPYTRLEDVSAQSRGRHRRDGSVCGADRLVPPSLWTADHAAQPAADPVVWCHGTSDGGMACKSAHGSLWLGESATVSDP